MISQDLINDNLKGRFMDEAFRMGTELCRTAIWHQGSCNWIGRNYDFDRKFEFFESLGSDFYLGTSGISFFLHHLHDATGEKLFAETASGAMNHAMKNIPINSGSAFGFYSGSAGIIYVLLDVYYLTKEEKFLSEAIKMLGSLVSKNVNDADADVISGAAGCIFLLLFAYELLHNEKYIEKATELGNFLLSNAKAETVGISWKTISGCERNLTGYSHGSAGIGLSLLLLHSRTGEEKFLKAYEKSFQYEDFFFNEKILNWPDFRIDDGKIKDEIKYSNAWCHGSPGIGLARLLAYLITKEDKLFSVAEKVSGSVRNNLSNCNNFSLCHGYFGNAELPLLLARHTGNNNIIGQICKQAENILTVTEENGGEWKCGSMTLRAEPGFMCGQSGIGNFLLRLSNNFKYDSGIFIEKLFPVSVSPDNSPVDLSISGK
ncbi:MAG: lanthionine synthetase LanC family protein [Bacteroidia bacterium]